MKNYRQVVPNVAMSKNQMQIFHEKLNRILSLNITLNSDFLKMIRFKIKQTPQKSEGMREEKKETKCSNRMHVCCYAARDT